jgi:hypothetical protein
MRNFTRLVRKLARFHKFADLSCFWFYNRSRRKLTFWTRQKNGRAVIRKRIGQVNSVRNMLGQTIFVSAFMGEDGHGS